MGHGGDLDFTCRCKRCTDLRRERWQKEATTESFDENK